MYMYKTKFMLGNLNNVYCYNVFMRGDDYVVHFIVPGFSKNELELSMGENVLFLTAKKEKPISKLFPKSIHGEVLIEDGFEISDATLENGVLTVTLKRKIQNGVKIPIRVLSSRTQERPQVLMENNQENNNM